MFYLLSAFSVEKLVLKVTSVNLNFAIVKKNVLPSKCIIIWKVFKISFKGYKCKFDIYNRKKCFTF